LILVKLGGSVITDKRRIRTFRKQNCLRLCRELRGAAGELFLIHGAGSFGHIMAARYDLQNGVGDDEAERLRKFSQVHMDVRKLNSKVMACMRDNRLTPFSLPPFSFATFSSGKIREFRPEVIGQLVDIGMTPVSFGDIVPDDANNFAICSGDLVMAEAARQFRPSKVIFVADVDGVYDYDPKMNKNARLLGEISPEVLDDIMAEGSGARDVTGSMRGKIERMIEISRHCDSCIVLNGNSPGRLAKAIKGTKVVSTKVIH